MMTKDPIRGMTVDPESAPSATRDGKEYHFCSKQCLNQFVSATSAGKQGDPCTIVIFGVSGDLSKRKLLPALYNLAAKGLPSDNVSIIGVARRPWSEDESRQKWLEDFGEFGTQESAAEVWNALEGKIRYCQGSFDEPETYSRLKTMLEETDEIHHSGSNALFYLSVQPESFSAIVEKLHAADLTSESTGNWRRVVIEKPFGHDMDSAQTLNKSLTSILHERQVIRVDHYLGKETAQNLLVFRLGNSMIEPVWNRNSIDHIEITAAEALGIEGRGACYENTGAVRDMIQSHMLMLLALIAMEPPSSSAGETILNEKGKLLESIRIPSRAAFSKTRFVVSVGRGKWTETKSLAIATNREFPRLSDRDLCRDQAMGGQLALGVCAIQSPLFAVSRIAKGFRIPRCPTDFIPRILR